MPFSILPLLKGIGSAIGSSGIDLGFNQLGKSISAAREQRYNERNMALQYEYQKKMVDYINKYNLPTKSVARWKAAGIAPQAVFGSSPGGAGVASDASAPSSDNPGTDSNFSRFSQTLVEQQRMENEKKVADSQADLNKALANKARGDTKDPDTTKRLQLLDLDRSELAKESERIQKDILDIEKDYKKYEKEADLSIKRQILFETMAKIDKLLADKEVSEETKKKLQADRDLVQEQINTEKAKQRNLDADADLKDAYRKTENDLRDGKVKIQQSEAKRVIQLAFNGKLQNVELAEQLARIMTGSDRSSSLYSVLDKAIESIGTREHDEKENVRRRFLDELRNFEYLHE